jgi:hypothetical protein
MDILNFISWIKAGKYSPTMPADAITVVGVPNPTRGDAYLPVTIPVTAFADLFPVSNTNIGKLLGGGIVVAEWDENGVKKALIASLTDLSASLPYTIPLYDITLIGPTAQSWSDGLGNTNAIIAQTGIPVNNTYAAGAARMHTGGTYTDWYLPALWELNMCYDSAAIVNKVLGSTNGFISIGSGLSYKSSTEANASTNFSKSFIVGTQGQTGKSSGGPVRAVRIHTL